jgi:hypothetical protein
MADAVRDATSSSAGRRGCGLTPTREPLMPRTRRDVQAQLI